MEDYDRRRDSGAHDSTFFQLLTQSSTSVFQTHNLSKHLGHMRKAYNISHSLPSPAQQPPAPSSRTRRPMPDPAASPQTTRLSRAPNVPGIYEDDEDCETSSSPDETERAPSPTIRRKMKARLSASRLPLPSRVSSPPLSSAPPLVIESKGKRRINRRQSGLLTVDTARPPSPAVGSAMQKFAQEAEPDEEEEAAITEEMNVDAELEAALQGEERKNNTKEQEREADKEVANESSRPRERKRRRDNEEASSTTTSNSEGANKLKDVTNSPRGRSALPQLDTTTSGMCSTLHLLVLLTFIMAYSLYCTCRSRTSTNPRDGTHYRRIGRPIFPLALPLKRIHPCNDPCTFRSIFVGISADSAPIF